ncbi:S26 family signal peptidase [Pusillimonas noertemannii]|uniref:Conjugative transfer signal peptidase TraF n=1 Tax=Pusillimonas noertemannii TaxID=305977 RepID=A0A2U1CMA7_9BURK|nr:S26 family signal peptidase [Pusillimonas noertemannii]NYT68858.1 S26 family signal peptidase [Pusillimonas noertemannii]PVY62121.1 conjugative transfer signal peptidase TraF [Pusillimonas noertemannii]TFL10887.1 S26 family signal peptidase [Pusillimonas noertemannii]
MTTSLLNPGRSCFILGGMALGLAALFAPVLAMAPLRVVFNVSDSAPRGFYAVSAQPIRRGDYIVTRLPADIVAFAAERRYLPGNVPLLKRVAAAYGDHVCVRSGAVGINGRVVASTLARDSRGRPLAAWPGCRLLRENELFLLAGEHRASFDSRYFGPIVRAAAYGRAAPLWVWGPS